VELSVRGLLQHCFATFEQRHALPAFRRHAAHALATCKTASRGRHIRRCPHGHVEGVWYNSCRHRSCPQCSALEVDRWLQGRQPWLLPCPHHHLVFTLPSDLNELWQLNTKLLTELLFEAARWALQRLLEDPRRLGARAGALVVLHTWGRTLCLHPHLHCLVTAGGADRQGRWRPSPRAALLPCRPLGELFRGYFLRRLERLARTGKLRLPADYRDLDALWLLRRAAGKKWTPHISERYLHGQGVLRYLARYVRGGPFRNSSLVSADTHQVAFRYQSWRDLDHAGKPQTHILSLPTDDFIARLLAHVPKPNTRTVRGWGLYAHTQRTLAEACRSQIEPPDDPPDLPNVTPEPLRRSHSLLCPVCGCRLLVTHLPFDGRPPPIP
jgi:hypothetical protein